MSNVIEVDFLSGDSGYVIDGEKITGIFHAGLSAVVHDNTCYVGGKGDREVTYPTDITIKNMNEFCIMWLCIYDPDVIKSDEE